MSPLDHGACVHARWVMMRLNTLAEEAPAKPLRLALFGNGQHTAWLLEFMRHLPLPLTVTLILDDAAQPSTRRGDIPVETPNAAQRDRFDVIIPSSDTHEIRLLDRIREIFGNHTPAFPLYAGFPPGALPKTDPALPRISIVLETADPSPGTVANIRSHVFTQNYANVEVLILSSSHSGQDGDEAPADTQHLLPWVRSARISRKASPPALRRAALEQATGDWVCFINPSDTLEPGALHHISQSAATGPAVILGGTRLLKDGHCIEVIHPRAESLRQLLECWHDTTIPPTPNAIFLPRLAALEAAARATSGDLYLYLYELILNLAESLPVTRSPEILASTHRHPPTLEPVLAPAIAARHHPALTAHDRNYLTAMQTLLSGRTEAFISDSGRIEIHAPDMPPSPGRPEHPLPGISIITPSYNARAYLARACHSVQRQAYPNVEHIVVDGASTDQTQNLFRHFPIRAISEPDHGMYAAINKGIRMASHPHILVLNADDFLEPGALHAIGTFLLEHPQTTFLTGQLRLIDTSRRIRYNASRSDRLADLLRWWMPHAYPYNTLAYVFTARLWNTVGGFDESLRVAADVDFVMKARLHTPFARMDTVFGTWMLREDCLTATTRGNIGATEVKQIVARYKPYLTVQERQEYEAQEASACAF